jgi:hypothetical protein
MFSLLTLYRNFLSAEMVTERLPVEPSKPLVLWDLVL